MLQMRLKSFNYIYCLLIISLCFTALKSEEKIDIWNKQNKTSLNEKKTNLMRKKGKIKH